MRKLLYLAAALCLAGLTAAGAIEFKPHPTARITVARRVSMEIGALSSVAV